MKYALAKDFDSPYEHIPAGTVRTEREWKLVFPKMRHGDVRMFHKWFTPRPKQILLEHLQAGDGIRVSDKVLAPDIGRKDSYVQIDEITPKGDIIFMYGSYLDYAQCRIEDVVLIEDKWACESPYRSHRGIGI